MDIEENKEYRSELIKLVRKNEIIWDKTKKVRLSYAKKTAIWNSIGKELGKPGELVRKNWQSLRDQYRRDLKRQVVDGIEPSWVHFDDMSFIRKFLRPRQFKACPDLEETEIARKECHEKNIKTRGSHSKIFRTSGNFMTQIFPTVHDHSNAAYKEHQESGDTPPLVNSAIRLHRPIKMKIHNQSVETKKYNASMGPPHETANELLVPRAQIPKIRIKNLSAKSEIKMHRKKYAVKKSREAQYLTRSRSSSKIIEARNEPLTPKKANIRQNVSCINEVCFEHTHSNGKWSRIHTWQSITTNPAC
uniref:Transcription factor Adf-1 n=1 Tax=Bactrocera dorsalis TaxID=27457 RepID=A0A034WL40_BACDO